MVSSRRIRVDDSFIDVMGKVGRPIAEKIKKDYNLPNLVIDHPTLSALVAGQLSKRKSMNFKIKKTGHNRGTIFFS